MEAFTKLTAAYNFAAHRHRNQRRKNSEGIPYINHPIEVADYVMGALLNSKMDMEDIIDTVIAGLFHDLIEDTETSYEEIEDRFGKKVADMVMEATDDKSKDKIVRKQLQIANASKKSHNAKIIKLSDQLSNLESLTVDPPIAWSVERIQGYFAWKYLIFVQLKDASEYLAHLLDIVFNATFPDGKKFLVSRDIRVLEQEVEKYYQLLRETGEK